MLKTQKVKDIKLIPHIGVGFNKTQYEFGMLDTKKIIIRTLLLPFFKIEWGELTFDSKL